MVRTDRDTFRPGAAAWFYQHEYFEMHVDGLTPQLGK
jgi:hypothetical protein